LEHLPSDTPSSGRGINVHAPQFHRAIRGAFQAECADQFVARDGNPKTAIPLGIVSRDTIDFFTQRTFDIRLESVAQMGQAEKSVDSDEQLPDLSGIVLRERADGYLCVHNLIPASSPNPET
jgi:hypothetical protein